MLLMLVLKLCIWRVFFFPPHLANSQLSFSMAAVVYARFSDENRNCLEILLDNIEKLTCILYLGTCSVLMVGGFSNLELVLSVRLALMGKEAEGIDL